MDQDTFIIGILIVVLIIAHNTIQHSPCNQKNNSDDKRESFIAETNNMKENNNVNKPLLKGNYGDVNVYFTETLDNKRASDWYIPYGGIYLHNSKTYWKDVNRPMEADFW